MKDEIEAKFLAVSHDDIRKKLASIDAQCIESMRLMKRAILDFPDKRLQLRSGYVRVRDEGDKVTLTYKQFNELSVDGAKEIETTVGDFDATIALLEQLGVEVKSLQESKRETWTIGSVEIVLDEWPWLDPYIEIEGDSLQDIQSVAEKLEFSWGDAVFGDVMVAYRAQYPHLTDKQTVGELKEVRFEVEPPAMFKPV